MIDPFRGLLLGVFFSVGMHIDLSFIWREPVLVIGGFDGHDGRQDGPAGPPLPAVRCTVGRQRRDRPAAGAGRRVRLHRHRARRAVQPGRSPGGGGVLAVVSLTMGTLPASCRCSHVEPPRRAAGQVTGDAPATQLPPADHAKRVIVVGHGRVGQLVCDLLDKHEISYIAADRDAARVERWRKLGALSISATPSNSLFLQRCGIDEATGVIVTIDTAAVDDVVRAVRARRPDVMIVARAHDAQHALHLYTLAVTHRAGDHRGEPAAGRIRTRRSGRPDGPRHCLDPRAARAGAQRTAGRRRRHRIDDGANCCRARREKGVKP